MVARSSCVGVQLKLAMRSQGCSDGTTGVSNRIKLVFSLSQPWLQLVNGVQAESRIQMSGVDSRQDSKPSSFGRSRAYVMRVVMDSTPSYIGSLGARYFQWHLQQAQSGFNGHFDSEIDWLAGTLHHGKKPGRRALKHARAYLAPA
jgi:hypothetical protein